MLAWVIGGTMVAVLIVIGVVLWLSLKSDNDNIAVKSAKTSTPSSSSSETLLEVGNNTGIGGGVQAEGQGEKLPSNSSSSNNASNNAQSKPQDFKEYDKYKDSKSALFGEIKFGTGDEALAGKQIAVAYKGWLTNNKLFEQTPTDAQGKTQPLVFKLGEHKVIPGIEQGVLGMKVGGKRLIIVPPSVGYGATGKDPIPPNSVLVFEVELLEAK